ncbi:hypothetical protein ONZ45_g12133 [Pleurotus djamor]|nr:hypothetical protein ONZ45_g12133 [Pleurotus djamor]
MELSFKRSRSCPLRVKYHVDDATSYGADGQDDESRTTRVWDLAQRMMKDSNRLETMSANFLDRDSLVKFVSSWSSDSAQCLRSLNLTQTSGVVVGGPGEIGERNLIPPNFLWTSLPNLMYLTLRHVAVPDELPLLPRIVRLSILDPQPKMTFEWFLKNLKSMTNVVFLHISGVAPEAHGRPPTYPSLASRIELPRLKYLDASFENLSHSKFLDFTNYPITTRLSLSFRQLDTPRVDSDLGRIQTAIQRFIPENASPMAPEVFFYEVVAVCSPSLLQLNIKIPPIGKFIVDELDVERASVQISIPQPENSSVEAYTRLFNGLPVSTVKNLNIQFIHGYNGGDLSLWTSFIRSFETLEKLTLDGWTSSFAGTVLNALTSPNTDTDTELQRVANKNLATLRISKFDLTMPGSYQWIKDFADERRRCGVPISKVELVSCILGTDASEVSFGEGVRVWWMMNNVGHRRRGNRALLLR